MRAGKRRIPGGFVFLQGVLAFGEQIVMTNDRGHLPQPGSIRLAFGVSFSGGKYLRIRVMLMSGKEEAGKGVIRSRS